MAQRHGGEWYTHFVFTENGVTINRRIHGIKVQGRDGWMYTLKGREMPDFIQLETGVGHAGKHLAEILLDPKNQPPPPKGGMKRWPSLRDASHLIIGITFAILIFRVLKVLAEVSR